MEYDPILVEYEFSGMVTEMEYLQNIIPLLFVFLIVSIAAQQFGRLFSRWHLPLITGFLLMGIIEGPDGLALIHKIDATKLKFIDEIALSFIAFAAGCELELNEIRKRIRSIAWITVCQFLSTFLLGSLSLYLVSDYIPFMKGMAPLNVLGISLLAGSILVARSPSSAIAIIKEYRAKGNFSRTVLGVTVLMDAVVIVLFSINSSIAEAIFSNLGIDFSFLLLLLFEFSLSIFLGYIVSRILKLIMMNKAVFAIKAPLILILGYGVYYTSHYVRVWSSANTSYELFLEPLLISIIGSFWMASTTEYRHDLEHLLDWMAPPIFIAFFTLTGASIDLAVVAMIWKVALVLFVIRLLTIYVGGLVGGIIAGEPMFENQISWMGYVTQAGVGLGLAKAVAVKFPTWGPSFSTMIISVIVLNQLVGPLFLKWSLFLVKEAHPRAKKSEIDTIHSAMIIGSEVQSLALAQQLLSHHWQVKMLCPNIRQPRKAPGANIDIMPLCNISLECLAGYGAREVGAIVTLLSDEENLAICEIAYEHFGRANLIVLLNERANFSKFNELGAFIVSPATAIIGLLDHFVRAPSAVSLLLGYEDDKNIIDVDVLNPELDGMTLRDVTLPDDVLVLAVHRKKTMLNVHGGIRFRKDDQVTLIGSHDSLEEVEVLFADY